MILASHDCFSPEHSERAQRFLGHAVRATRAAGDRRRNGTAGRARIGCRLCSRRPRPVSNWPSSAPRTPCRSWPSLLADEQLSHYARFALEPIPDPSVDEALRASLTRCRVDRWWALSTTIGMRRDAGSVEALAESADPSRMWPSLSAAAVRTWDASRRQPPWKRFRRPRSPRNRCGMAVADGCLTAADALEKENNGRNGHGHLRRHASGGTAQVSADCRAGRRDPQSRAHKVSICSSNN